MLKQMGILTLAALSSLSLFTATVPSAQAAIVCKGAYQHIDGTGYHSTPYCEIMNLYRVAHSSYGISTSFRRLRNIDSEREEVCQAIGHDYRVYSICLEYRNEGGDRTLR